MSEDSQKEKVNKVKKLGNYIILNELIGEGNFGKIYKCFEESNPKSILACKCLNLKYYMSNEIYLNKLKQELILSRTLNHINLVKLLDLKRTKVNLYMILEYINGDNFDNFLHNYFKSFKHGPSLGFIRFFSTEIINVLVYLSKNKIVHRDIKLENIMFHFVPFDQTSQRKEGNCFENEGKSEGFKSVCETDKEDLLRSISNSQLNQNQVMISKNEDDDLAKEDKENQLEKEVFYSYMHNSNEIDEKENESKFELDKLNIERSMHMLDRTSFENQHLSVKTQLKKLNSKWENSKEIELLIMNSQLKLLDFGLGKDLSKSNGYTQSICGTPETMAPEIWMNKINLPDKKDYDFKVDIWSFGCILFNLVTGTTPFSSENIENICHKVVNQGIYYIPTSNSLPIYDKDTDNLYEISLEFIDLINNLLQFDPLKRLTWNEIAKHPFLNSPVSKQLKITDFLRLIGESKEVSKDISHSHKVISIEENVLLNKVITKKGKTWIAVSIHENLRLIDFASKKKVLDSLSHLDFYERFEGLYTIEDYFSNKNNEISMDSIFEKEEKLVDYEFNFVEVEEGFIKVDLVYSSRKKD